MESLRTRNLPLPELILAGLGMLVVMFIMVRTSSGDCHHWKERITYVGGAFLAAAGEEEYPQPESGVASERSTMSSEARKVLDERPLGCL